MLRIHRRVEKLERVLRVNARPAHAFRLDFIDGDGRLCGYLVSSSDPALCVPYREIEDGEGKPHEDAGTRNAAEQ
jgi:hypothetical protein